MSTKTIIPVLICITMLYYIGFLLRHSLQQQQTNSNETKVRRKRTIDSFEELDYSHDSYAVLYDYHKYQETSYYDYEQRNFEKLSIGSEDRDTYEEVFRKYNPTPHDPSRRRAFGTRIRMRKISAPLTTEDNNSASFP